MHPREGGGGHLAAPQRCSTWLSPKPQRPTPANAMQHNAVPRPRSKPGGSMHLSRAGRSRRPCAGPRGTPRSAAASRTPPCPPRARPVLSRVPLRAEGWESAEPALSPAAHAPGPQEAAPFLFPHCCSHVFRQPLSAADLVSSGRGVIPLSATS